MPQRKASVLYAGTSGWAYPEWRAKFYPADLPQARFLEFYARRFHAVEVNYTFCGRHALTPTTAEGWLAQTDENFVFAFRGPKPITHFHRHRLRNAEHLVRQFQTTLLPFGRANRLGPILFQLPETFSVDVQTLDDFLREWPREWRVSFEFRNRSWFTDAVYDVLQRHGAALCVAERDESETPEALTAGFTYLRLRRSAYSPTALEKIAERLERYAERGDVFAFFARAIQDRCTRKRSRVWCSLCESSVSGGVMPSRRLRPRPRDTAAWFWRNAERRSPVRRYRGASVFPTRSSSSPCSRRRQAHGRFPSRERRPCR